MTRHPPSEGAAREKRCGSQPSLLPSPKNTKTRQHLRVPSTIIYRSLLSSFWIPHPTHSLRTNPQIATRIWTPQQNRHCRGARYSSLSRRMLQAPTLRACQVRGRKEKQKCRARFKRRSHYCTPDPRCPPEESSVTHGHSVCVVGVTIFNGK